MEQKWLNKLTNEELKLISDTYFPYVKKNAMHKIQAQLVELGQSMLSIQIPLVQQNENEFKITKGENYKDLPYMVLDYPKIAGPHFRMLYRTMFWWGKYIGLQIILKNEGINIKDLVSFMQKEENVYVLITTNLWNNDVETSDYLLLDENFGSKQIRFDHLKYLKFIKVEPIKKTESLFESVFGFYKNINEGIKLSAQ